MLDALRRGTADGRPIQGTGRRHMEEEIKRGVLTVIHNGLLW